MRVKDTTIHGERIEELRKVQKITQEELAKRIGISKFQLSRIENGETKTLSSNLLMRIADEFDVSTDYILGVPTSRADGTTMFPLLGFLKKQSSSW